MSYFFESARRCDYPSNKETDNFFLSANENDDKFAFEYVPASRFERLVKNVQRQRMKMKEERKWDSFAERRGSDDASNNFSSNVDRELRRLEEDAMPEIDKTHEDDRRARKRDGRTEARSGEKIPGSEREMDARSSNLLLAIPEERRSHPLYRKSGDRKPELVGDMRKSSSDYAVRGKRQLGELMRAMNESECNSGRKPSLAGVGEEEEKFFARLDPAILRKVLDIQKKVSSILDEISTRLDAIPLPDGDRDLSRRIQRVAEFSVRFSRYYLYDLGRRLTDMRRHVLALFPNARSELPGGSSIFHLHAVGQKMIVAHQILLQALSAYRNHIPNSTVKGHRRRLREILRVITDLKDMCDKINVSAEYHGSGDTDAQSLTAEIHRKCRSILSKLQLKGLPSDDESQLTSHTTRSTIAAVPTASRSQRRHKPKRLSSRLSMYSMGEDIPKLHPARRPRTSLQRPKKYANTSSKLSHYNRSTPPKQPNCSPVTIASLANGTAGDYSEKVSSSQREDDIKTMVEISPPDDSDLGSSVEASSTNRYFDTNSLATKSDVPRRFSTSRRTAGEESRKLKNDKKIVDDRELTEKVSMITEEHLSSLVPVIADLMSLITSKQNDFQIRPVSSSSMETLLEFLQKYQTPHGETAKPTSPKPNRLKETRTGPGNMQLICLPYEEDKDEESSSGDFPRDANLGVSDLVEEMPREGVTCRVAIRNAEAKGAIRLVAPTAGDSIIPKYHRRYQRFIRADPMYLSNTNNKPWDVVAWYVSCKIENGHGQPFPVSGNFERYYDSHQVCVVEDRRLACMMCFSFGFRIADKLVDDSIAELSKELEMHNIIKKMFDLEFEEY